MIKNTYKENKGCKAVALLLFIVLGGAFAYSQTYTYEYKYDDAGNREKRIISTVVLKSSDSMLSEEDVLPVEDLHGELSLKIYPNPTKGLMRVEVLNKLPESMVEIRLYGVDGTLLITRKNVEGSVELDLSNFSSGSYIMHIFVNGRKKEWKIIKE